MPVGFVRSLLPALSLVLLIGPSVLRAQEENLPKAEVILDKYVEVTGGKAAYDKLNNRVTKGTLEMVAQGLKFSLTVYGSRPNKFYSLMESEAFGKIEKGADGQVVWETSLMVGPQIKEGEERALMLRGAVFDATEHWRKVYKKAECASIETVDGKPCYKIVLTPKEGQTLETRYYDKESGLLGKSEMNLELPMGTIPMEVYRSDYRKVDGVLISHKIKQVIAGVQETLFVTESVEHNVKLPKDRFALPAEIQALVDKQKSEKTESKTP